MGGLTSKCFHETRIELCEDYHVDMSLHDVSNGWNPTLDRCLEQVPMLSNRVIFKQHIETHGMSFSSLMRLMCYMGFGSKIVNEMYPDLTVLDHIIQELRQLSQESNMKGKLTLLEERKNAPRNSALFRLIRPFFLHRLSEGLVALLGARFCRDNWKWDWDMMENTLAVLYRYIPRGLTRARNTVTRRYFFPVVRAIGQVGLHGQNIFSDILGRVPTLVGAMRKVTRYRKCIGPKSVMENIDITFEQCFCSQITLPPVFGFDRIHPERVFKDIVVFVSTQGIHERFDCNFQDLVREMQDTCFKANPPLSVYAAWQKRNEIYEKKLRGIGNPWCHESWNFKDTVTRKLCQPELGWEACTSITDYLSGTINCKDIGSLLWIWQKLKNNKMFKICKMINRLNTLSRELLCIGKLDINPPMKHYFYSIEDDKRIDTMLATIRIRWTSPFEDYDHFEIARKNYLLHSFYSPEQFFFPRVCNYEKELLDERAQLMVTWKHKSKKKLRNKGEMKESIKCPDLSPFSEPLPITQKRVCPKDHLLTPIPKFHTDRTCGICGRVVDKGINWYCQSCNWISCNDCWLMSPRALNSPNDTHHKHGISINFDYTSTSDIGVSSAHQDNINGRRGVSVLQGALTEKDQQLRDLQLRLRLSFSKSQPLKIYKKQVRNLRINQSSFAGLENLGRSFTIPLKLKQSQTKLKGLSSQNITENSCRQLSLGNIGAFLRTSEHNNDKYRTLKHSPDLSTFLIDDDGVLQEVETSHVEETELSCETGRSVVIPLSVI